MGKKISELDPLGSLSGDEITVVSFNGKSYQIPVSLIKPIITRETLGLGNIDNTADLDKPLSNETTVALSGKSDIVHIHAISSIFNLENELAGRALTIHVHSKSEIGLGNVDDTSDEDKPVSIATQDALNGKANTLHNHLKSDVGLGNVDNTSDLAKPVSNATQAVLNTKSSINHTHIKADIGLANVDNTSDLAKPISNAQQSALNTKVNNDQLGAVGGVATLDSARKLTASQLPDIVTDSTRALIENTAVDIQSSSAPITHIGTGGESHANATQTTSGFLSESDKVKLDSLETNANFYVHPEFHPPTIIAQDQDNRFVSDLQIDQWDSMIPSSEKGEPNGVATLDVSGKIPASQLPSYVDDVIEVNSVNELPISGETSKIYLTISDNKVYRWSGSIYIDLSPHSGKTLVSSVNGRDGDVIVSKSDVGLSEVDNTSDTNKPISTATQTALNALEASKSELGHQHTTSDIQGLDSSINTINTELLNRSLIGHQHDITDVTGLRSELDSKSDITHSHSKSEIGLGNVDNTSDLNKPISTATQSALDSKSDSTHVHSIVSNTENGFMSSVDKIKLDGIESDANNYIHPANHSPSIITQDANNRFVSDVEKATWSGKQDALGFIPEDTANRGIANGYATLDSSGRVPASQLPSYVDDVLEYNSLAEFPDPGSFGKIYVAIDSNFTYRWSGTQYIILSNGDIIEGGIVTDINGQTGSVTLTKSDIGLSNVDNTSDINKPISTATQTALNNKANTGHIHLVSEVSGLQTQLDSLAPLSALNNYDTTTTVDSKLTTLSSQKANTVHTHAISDITGLQTVLNGKSDVGHTHSKSEVGLGNVDNTSDLNKPISTAVQTALNSKVNASSLGTVNGVATLDVNGKVPASQLPAGTDEVIESTNFASLPAIGEVSKLYITLNDNKLYRWSGSNYVDIIGANTGVTSVAGRTGAVTLTKSDVGLSNVDNTSDANKPISTATQTALNGKVSTSHVGTGGSEHALVTTTVAGFMSSADKVKLDGVSGVNTGDQTTITGNAGTATKLQTARTINGTSFDGSANITINAVDSTARIASSEKGVVNGVATLDATGKIPSGQLPLFVDDVLEYANTAGFPATGATGIIYVAIDTNKLYRWNGSGYTELAGGAATVTSVAGRTGAVTLTKADVGLSNVDNTSDTNKPISTATQTALNSKSNTGHTHTKSEVGLANVDNTSDANKPLSSPQKNYVDTQIASVFRTGSYGSSSIYLETMTVMVNGEPELLFNNSGSVIVGGVL